MAGLTAFAGLDGGGSGARFAAVDLDGAVLLAPTDAGLDGGTNPQDGPLALRRLDQAVDALGAALGEHRLAALCVATAGIDLPGDAETVLGHLATHPRLVGVDVRVVSDIEPALGEGRTARRVAVIAGTGSSVRAARFVGGRQVADAAAGGIDWPLTDWLAGGRLVVRALEAAVRDALGVEASALGLLAAVRLGLPWPDGWRELKRVVRPDGGLFDKREVAGLLPDLLGPAVAAGDPVATRLLGEEARFLAEAVAAGLARVGGEGPVDVLCMGSVLQRFAPARRAFEAEVRARVPEVAFVDVEPALAAARAARAAYAGR